MSEALAPYHQVNIATELPAIFQLARALSKATGFLPQHLRNEGEIAAVMLAGIELGLQPMVSLRSLNMIKGKVVISADVQLGLMLRAGIKAKWLSDGRNGKAELELSRAGHEPHVSTFTLEDAQRAGLASNDNYRKHQGAMLRARCVSSAARAYCPDILAGCYVPGEIDETPPDTHREAMAAFAGPITTTLDDVDAGGPVVAEATKVEKAPKPEVPYTAAGHIKALELCKAKHLAPWLDKFFSNPRTDEEEERAHKAFAAKCMLENVDHNRLIAEWM
jgi:hypothetical protein